VYLCVLCGTENKQRLLSYTTLADWFCITVVESVYSAVRTDCLFDIKQVFLTAVESAYSAVRTDCLYKAGFYNCGGKCLQRGTD
jgi:hypothetical protein